MSANTLLRSAAALVALVAGVFASGYDVIRDRNGTTSVLVKWANGNIPMQVKLGTTPTLSDGSNYSTSTVAAMESWNQVIRNSQFAGTIAAAGNGGEDNGISELFFSPNVYGQAYGTNVIAVTLSSHSSSVQSDGTYRRTESDILFNSDKSWDSYRGATRSALDIRRVALHELGHALGLDHPDEWGQSVSAIMNSHVSSIDALQRDDMDGAQYIYGVTLNSSTGAPENDNFANATALFINGTATTTMAASSVKATKEPGEPNHASGESGGASVWWKWTATATGSLEVTTAGTNFDTLLAAYTGTAIGSLTQLASNDDVVSPSEDSSQTRPRTSRIVFNVTSGTTYYLAVDGWAGEWGSVQINATLSSAPVNAAPVITTQPQSQSVNVGANVVFSVVATGTPNPTYQWNKNGSAISGATGTTLSITNAQTTDAGTYTVTVTNSLGSVTSEGATLTVNTVSRPPSSGGGGGGGGGGAPSHWFLAALALAMLARWRQRRH